MIIAHRGASGYRPEHTEAAYRLAIAMGADAVEPDLVVSRDGVVVVRHDRELSGSTDIAEHPEFAGRRRTGRTEHGVESGWFVEDFDWPELATLRAREPRPDIRPTSARFNGQQPIMRFSQLLALLDKRHARSATGAPTKLVAELKDSAQFASRKLDLPALVLADLASAGWAADDARLVFESFEPEALDALAGYGKRVLLVDYPEHWSEDGLLAIADFDGLSTSVEHLLAEPELVKYTHDLGKLMYAYTLRPENAFLPSEFRLGTEDEAWGNWRALFGIILDLGLDGVFADQPELVSRLLG